LRRSFVKKRVSPAQPSGIQVCGAIKQKKDSNFFLFMLSIRKTDTSHNRKKKRARIIERLFKTMRKEGEANAQF